MDTCIIIKKMDFGFLVFKFVAFLVNFLALFALQLPLLQPLHQEVPKVNIQLPGEDHQDPGQMMTWMKTSENRPLTQKTDDGFY